MASTQTFEILKNLYDSDTSPDISTNTQEAILYKFVQNYIKEMSP